MRRRALFLAGLMVATLVVASGIAWAASISCPNRAGNLCVGTSKSDTMIGRNRADDMRGKEGGDTLRARGGMDILAGGKGKDVLKGGDADDIYDFPTNDWGNDTIVDTADSDTDPDTGNFAQFGFPDQLTTRITVNLTSSPSSPEVSNGTFTGTVNWSNNAIDGVYVDSLTDDTIIGNSAANQLTAKGGPDSDDTMNGGAGNDLLNVLDFDGGDTVTCGDGFDEVFFDAGDTLIDPAACEIKH
jgi:Ca2+-binding RTX toxin-like protein